MSLTGLHRRAVKCDHPEEAFLRRLLGKEAGIQRRSDGRTVGLEGHARSTRLAAVKRRVMNPSAQIFVMSKDAPYLQPKEPRIGIDEPWGYTAIAAVPMDQN
jgi:hypothetical protein